MKVVIDDKIPFLRNVFEPYATVVYKPGKDISQSDLVDAQLLIVRTRTKCNKNLLEGTSVQMVSTATIGTDHMDISWLEQAGITWSNAPGCNSGSVRQYIGSVLAHLIISGINPAETTIGIVGVGMVGSKVEQLARTLGFKVMLNDPPRARREGDAQFTDYRTLVSNADIITYHTPLNMSGPDASYHLLSEDLLNLLKPGVVIINSSRGEVTDTKAMLSGLTAGMIGKLVLDVWENEPDISSELHEKVWIGTPHIAGYSVDGKANGSSMTVDAVSHKFGLPLVGWKPDSLPTPENPVIVISDFGKTSAYAAAEAILRTYNILEDHQRLRQAPSDFEKLRGSYPVRREFDSWTVEGNALRPETLEMIENLGFKLKN